MGASEIARGKVTKSQMDAAAFRRRKRSRQADVLPSIHLYTLQQPQLLPVLHSTGSLDINIDIPDWLPLFCT
jgi:hypothetical protein